MPVGVLIGSNDPIPFNAEALARAFAEPGTFEHLRRGNTAFGDWASLFAAQPLVWTPDTPRAEAPLTAVFPREEFYITTPGPPTDVFARGARPAAAPPPPAQAAMR